MAVFVLDKAGQSARLAQSRKPFHKRQEEVSWREGTERPENSSYAAMLMPASEKCLKCILHAFPIRNTKLLNKECPEFVALPYVRIPLNAPQSYASN